ncbi:MAG: UDP-N-acetylglucosamine 2-epimerase (non-hydrolyzing) [Gammaproteobacteria bacterium]|nr:MAG: UDP-N-acetylglucosamine 2-epimerase (non-hydrolyzing) [Gammaproteobacteria bacterium]
MKTSPLCSPGSPILCVAGARPNFMKIAPIISWLQEDPYPIPIKLVHTGQHYDAAMNDTFFNQLQIPSPDIALEVGSGSHAFQTAEIMKRFEPVVDSESPVAVLVVGDVNSTIACALVAAKKGIPVIHVEAGLRSYDRGMPEEINRVLTDQLSELLFITEPAARENLLREGIAEQRIFHVGNVMIDTLHRCQALAVPVKDILTDLDNKDLYLKGNNGYCVLTLHRPSNVDNAQLFRQLLETVRMVSEEVPVIFPIHPRTRNRIAELGLQKLIESPRIVQLQPLGYLEMLGLVSESRLVMTDSGGLQEETTVLGVPCITLRDNTERPVTVEQGTNTVVGHDRQQVMSIVSDVLRNGGKQGRTPELWDGKAAIRIKSVLADWLQQRDGRSAIANG